MLFSYEEYTWWQNLLILVGLYAVPLIVYFIIRPIMYRYWEKRSGPIEEGTDVSDEEYWDD
ncbi:MAG: hypothetical protein ACFFF4_14875 [Candidatus Thorarchaeota archaeon]